jgi:RNA polymerase primary sigma factor
MDERNMLDTIDETAIEGSALDLLIRHGRRAGSVSVNEILDLIPEVELDERLFEDVLVALSEAGITYLGSVDTDIQAEESSAADDADSKFEGRQHSVHDLAEDDLKDIEVDDGLRLYIREASRIPLLTAKEEKELAQRIERGQLAQQELVRGRVRPAHAEELRSLIQDGWAAREQLIRANARLVISVAKKYIGYGMPFLDLIQEGNIGLMRAAKKFDYRRGFKFSTYATWWIRQAITRSLAEQSRTIRLPVHLGDQINRMLRLQHQLQQELGRAPNNEELAEALGVPLSKVEQMREVVQHPVSLQTPVGEDDDEMLGDFIEDREAPNPEDAAMQTLMTEDLREALSNLPPREMHILQLRFGLVDGEPLTLNEVGRRMGITRERARQLESQALQRLRNPLTQNKLRAYI